MQNLRELIDNYCHKYSDQTLFQTKRHFRLEKYSYQAVLQYIKALGQHFSELGLKPKDKFLIVAPNSPEMATLLLAGYYHNRIVIPTDVRSTPELLKKFIDLTKPKVIFTTKWRENDLKKIHSQVETVEGLFYKLQDITATNKNAGSSLEPIDPQETAEIMFTSGTTGTPKGTVLTHRNLVTVVKGALPIIPPLPFYETLSILPLSHIFEQVTGLLAPMAKGMTINYARKVNSVAIKRILQDRPITHLVIVPQIMKNLYRSIQKEVDAQGKTALFNKMQQVAAKLPFPLRRLLFKQVHKKLGGHIQFLISGGAKLDVNIARTWENMGFIIMEGYGATENAAVAAANLAYARKIGSVGKPIAGMNIKIDSESKEIMLRGDQISPGYYKNKEKTEEAFTADGWYRTGDMGEFDNEGFLHILGRDAFKIVLSSGENVFVEDLESQLNQQAGIWEAAVIGQEQNGRERVHAVIIPEANATDKDVDLAIKRLNSELESHQQINSYEIWPEDDFPRTATQKINRKQVKAVITQDPSKTAKEDSDSTDDQFLEILADISPKAANDIKETHNLGSDLSLDSIDRVELIALLEDEFNVAIDDYQVSGQTSVQQLRQMITKQESQSETKLLNWLYFSWPIRWLRFILQKLILFPVHARIFKVSVKGKENIPNANEPVIYMHNHIGPFDSVTFWKHLPGKNLRRLSAAATENFWTNDTPIDELALQLLAGAFQVSPLDGGSGARSSLARIGAMLDKGFSVVVAPEGKISRDGQAHKIQRGAALMATTMQAKIVPIKISGDYLKAFPNITDAPLHTRGFSQYIPQFKRQPLQVEIGKPIDLSGLSYEEAQKKLSQAVQI